MILLIMTYGILLLTPPEGQGYLTEERFVILDWTMIAILGIEFAIRLWRASDKRRFLLRNGWELIALIPFDTSFRLLRLLRLLRFAALLRQSPLLWTMLTSPTLGRILAFAGVIIAWSSAGIYMLEAGVNGSIQSFGDAVWWSVVTTTTVGYGDISPVTVGGRVIASFLMITGIGMIGTITANLANHWIEFSGQGKNRDAETDMKEQLKAWVDRLPEMSDREYAFMLETMALLRSRRASAADRAEGADRADAADRADGGEARPRKE